MGAHVHEGQGSRRGQILGESLFFSWTLQDVVYKRNLFNYLFFLLLPPHLFTFLCGVDVSYEMPPFSPVLHVLPYLSVYLFFISHIVTGFI